MNKKYKIYHYQSISGRSYIDEALNKLPAKDHEDGYTVLAYLENGEFDKLTIKSWDGKIKEVYFGDPKKNGRIFYCIFNDDEIYLLHISKKQKNKTEKKDSDIIKKRFKEVQKYAIHRD